MMLFLAIVATLTALIGGLLIAFANGMSDAPTEQGVSYWSVVMIGAVAGLLWLCWWNGWHPSW